MITVLVVIVLLLLGHVSWVGWLALVGVSLLVDIGLLRAHQQSRGKNARHLD
jgi:hypothetical protein